MRCHVLNLIPHGRYTCTRGFVVDSRCEFTCDPGYRIEGEHSRTCQHRGSWSGVQPLCSGMLRSDFTDTCKANQMFKLKGPVCNLFVSTGGLTCCHNLDLNSVHLWCRAVFHHSFTTPLACVHFDKNKHSSCSSVLWTESKLCSVIFQSLDSALCDCCH